MKRRNAYLGGAKAPSFERRHRSSSASHSPPTIMPMALVDQAASPKAAARFIWCSSFMPGYCSDKSDP